MRVFQNAWFRKFARKEQISDSELCEAVARAEAGLIDADLGGGLVKQRLARPGGGRSGGYRTLIFLRAPSRAVFAFGFAKKDRDNLDRDEIAVFKKAAKIVLALSDARMKAEINSGRMTEIDCNGRDLQE